MSQYKQEIQDLYVLWNELLCRIYKAKSIPLENISPNVLGKVLSAFEKVYQNIPEDLIPAYYCYVCSLCKSLKIMPDYRQLRSDKNISNFLKKNNIAVVVKRKLAVCKSSEELQNFIDEVKKIKKTLGCDNSEAFLIAKNQYLWGNLENINYFISRVSAGDVKYTTLLAEYGI